jgi:hypothetical protein
MKIERSLVRAVVAAAAGLALAGPAAALEITPAMQAELDRQKAVVAGWAADPVVVAAVRAQNARGPLEGMDNARWKTVRRSDPTVKGFQDNPAGRVLKARVEAAGGTFNEAFLNAAQGEKVAFVEKTTSYIHKGSAKFDVPYGTGKAWQGKPEFDESSQTHAVQIAVPVLDGGRPIGALVVGVNLTHLEKVARK